MTREKQKYLQAIKVGENAMNWLAPNFNTKRRFPAYPGQKSYRALHRHCSHCIRRLSYRQPRELTDWKVGGMSLQDQTGEQANLHINIWSCVILSICPSISTLTTTYFRSSPRIIQESSTLPAINHMQSKLSSTELWVLSNITNLQQLPEIRLQTNGLESCLTLNNVIYSPTAQDYSLYSFYCSLEFQADTQFLPPSNRWCQKLKMGLFGQEIQ